MTTCKDSDPARKRRYPAFYEKAVPIALAILVIAIVLPIVFGVALGLFPGMG